MRHTSTRLIIATFALALAACAGPGDEAATLASRVAQATSRSVLHVVVDRGGPDESESLRAPAPEPLELAASRPDAILSTLSSPDGHDATARAEHEPAGHVATPTLSATTAPVCRENSYRSPAKKPLEARLETTDCPLPRPHEAGAITRL